MNHGYVKTFEDYAKELKNEIPKEGDKKPQNNRRIILGPDTQNPANNTHLETQVGTKYPHGGL